jgi:hypothetical protein
VSYQGKKAISSSQNLLHIPFILFSHLRWSFLCGFFLLVFRLQFSIFRMFPRIPRHLILSFFIILKIFGEENLLFELTCSITTPEFSRGTVSLLGCDLKDGGSIYLRNADIHLYKPQSGQERLLYQELTAATISAVYFYTFVLYADMISDVAWRSWRPSLPLRRGR